MDGLVETTEGATRLLVPAGSLSEAVPPRDPAFFNPRARMNRDISMAAYAALLRGFRGPGVLLDSMAGLGARGLRAACELGLECAVLNDANPAAVRLARRSAALNSLGNAEFSNDEACRFLAGRSRGGARGAIVDIDPFGSPAAYLDCGIRAAMHGGMLAVTATDLQVLGGLYDSVCRRRYGGVPARTEYGNEVAIRLVLGCVAGVAGRMGAEVRPLFVESEMHYYRAYVRVRNRQDQQDNSGYILHCPGCGHREAVPEAAPRCRLCGGAARAAGPLWTGAIFDPGFVGGMCDAAAGLPVGEDSRAVLQKCLSEAGLPATYHTLDVVASRTRSSPPRLARVLERLAGLGFAASPTAFDPTGFRTDAGVREIDRAFASP